MAVVPTITLCVANNSAVMRITDNTGVYNASSNTDGWETPNEGGSDVTAVTLKITDPSGNDQTETVTTEFPATVVGNFAYADIDPGSATGSTWPDGQYTVLYTVTTSTTTYYYTLYTYIVSNAQCIVDKLFAKVPAKLTSDSYDDAQFIDQAMLAKALLCAVKSSVACNEIARADDIITRIERLGDINDCNCN